MNPWRPGNILIILFLLMGFLLSGFSAYAESTETAEKAGINFGFGINDLLSLSEDFSATSNVSQRAVYPYSIVPGGAGSVDEARTLMQGSLRYTALISNNLHLFTSTQRRMAFVSYLWTDGKVYWTRKQIAIGAGEEMFTDGATTVRGRCLNQVSAVPMLPVRPTEPVGGFEHPVFRDIAPLLALEEPEAEMMPVGDELGTALGATPSTVDEEGTSPDKGGGAVWWPYLPLPVLPLIPILFDHHRHPVESPVAPIILPPPTPPPPAAIPEPSLAAVIGILVMTMVLVAAKRRKTSRG